MNPWKHSFTLGSWDRYFDSQQRADEAWTAVLMDEAMRALLPIHVPIISDATFRKFSMATKRPLKSTPQGEKLRRDFGVMTPAELAVMLEISEYTLQGWRRKTPPEGPVFVYLGSKTYYRKEDVMSWIDDGLVRADFAGQIK